MLGNAKESFGIEFYGSFFKLTLGTIKNVKKCLKMVSNDMKCLSKMYVRMLRTAKESWKKWYANFKE